MAKSSIFYAADFEVNNRKEKNNVYCWGLMNSKREFFFGVNLGSFLEKVFFIAKKENKNVNVYFANGSNYDFHFILKYLKKENWTQKFTKKKKIVEVIEISEYKEKNIKKYNKNKYYTVFANELKSIFKLCLFCQKKQVSFYCSAKIWNISLPKMGDILNAKYKTEKYKKIDNFQYNNYYYFKSKNALLQNKNVYNYLKKDCEILTFFVYEMMQQKKITWYMTASNTAYMQWCAFFFKKIASAKNGVLVHKVKKNWDLIYYKKKMWKSKNKLAKKLISEKLLPVKKMEKVSLELRNWFSGGLTFFNQKYKGLIINNCNYIDINSSYSAVMKNENYPVGEIFFGDGGKNYPLKLLKIVAITDLENKRGIPFVKIKTENGVNDYPTKIEKNTVLYLTNIEFLRLKKYYQGEIYNDVIFSFQQKKGDYLFGEFIDFWWNKKVKSGDEAEKKSAKIMLNSLYGKFASKNLRSAKIFNPNLWDENSKTPTNWENETVLENVKYYLPIGIFITAYARMKLVDTVAYDFENCLYGDTDSLILRDKFILPEISAELGGWKLEYKNIDAFVLGKKKYSLAKNNKIIKSVIVSLHLNPKFWEHQNLQEHWFSLVKKGVCWTQLQKIETKEGFFLAPINKKIEPIWHKKYFTGKDAKFTDEKSFENYLRKMEKEILIQ